MVHGVTSKQQDKCSSGTSNIVHPLVLQVAEQPVHLEPNRACRERDEPASLIPRPVKNRILGRETRRNPEKEGRRFLLR